MEDHLKKDYFISLKENGIKHLVLSENEFNYIDRQDINEPIVETLQSHLFGCFLGPLWKIGFHLQEGSLCLSLQLPSVKIQLCVIHNALMHDSSGEALV